MRGRGERVTDFKTPTRIKDDDDVDVANDKCQAPGRCDWQQPSSKLIAHNLEKWVQVGEVWIAVVPQSTLHLAARLINRIEVG
ncbi:hypothetical protein ACLKA6_004765 [Drosophila palustris]